MTDFMTSATEIHRFLMFPQFLLDAEISETGKLVYLVLLDRARLSQKTNGWTNELGHVFIVYPIEELAKTMHKGERTIRRCLNELEHKGLIQRRHQGVGRADLIFVKLPSGQDCPPEPDKSDPSERSEMTGQCGQKWPGSNNYQVIPKESKEESKNVPSARGSFRNVFLTEEEYTDLRRCVSGCDSYIEKLSSYMVSTGKRYQCHHATIRSWASRDGKLSNRPRYECREDESL